LNILQHKGLIRESKGLLSIVSRQQALEEARIVKSTCQELLTARKQLEEWPAFAHIFVTKQRDSRFVAISDLEAYLDGLYEAIHKAAHQGQEDVVLQKTALLNNLFEHLKTTLLRKVDDAIAKARRIRRNTFGQADSFLENIGDIVNHYNRWLRQNATPENVKEAREVEEGKARLLGICTTPITLNDLSEEEKRDTAFAHQGWSSQDQHFNIALRRLQKSAESLQQKVGQAESRLEDIRQAIEAIEKVGQGTHSRLLTIQVSEEYKLSKVVRTRLEAFLRGVSATDSASATQPTEVVAPALTLNKILEDLQELHRPLNERSEKAKRAIDALQDLVEAETEFYNANKTYLEVQRNLAEKMDILPFQNRVQELEQKRIQTFEDYNIWASTLEESAVDQAVDYKTILQVKEEAEQYSTYLQTMAENFKQVWNDYVNESKHFVGSIQQLIQLAKKQDASLPTGHIETECEQLVQAVKSSIQEWPEKPMSHYETIKTNIRKTTMELLTESLDESEGAVLMAVIERREQSERGWFNLSQIAQQIATTTTTSGTEVEKLLRSLVQKGYLTEGIAIPI